MQASPTLPPRPDLSAVSLVWFAFAVLWLVAALGLFVFHSGLLLGHHAAPETVALVHMLVLGFLASATFGAVYQLLPVVSGVRMPWPPLAWLQLGLHQAGVPLMVIGFAHARFDWVAVGGAFVIAGVGAYAVNVLRTGALAKVCDVTLSGFVASALWLVVAVLAGLFMALNRAYAWVPVDNGAWLVAHSHAAVIGFFVSLVQGAAFRLVPMFTLGELRSQRGAEFSFWHTQGGLVALVFSQFDDLMPLRVAGYVLLAVGLVGTAWELRKVFVSRKRRALETGLKGFVVGAAGLGTAVVLGAILLRGSNGTSLPIAYGLLGLTGGLMFIVEGMLLKIFPFLVWMRAYGPLVGKTQVPLASQLSPPTWERVWLELRVVAVVLLCLGVVRAEAVWLEVASVTLVVAETVFIACLVRAGWHLRSCLKANA